MITTTWGHAGSQIIVTNSDNCKHALELETLADQQIAQVSHKKIALISVENYAFFVNGNTTMLNSDNV